MKVNLISKKRGHKQNSVKLNGYNSGKIVFILLTEVIALYIGPTEIDIWRPGLQLIPRSYFWYLGLENQLNDLL